MAMVLFYNRINWENYPSVVTPINETNLNKIDYAAKTLDERTVELYNTKADKSVLVNMIADWTLDENTGIITITKGNGNVIKFDLNIEKIPVNFEMSEDGVLKMTTEDGSIFTADIGSMIPIIKFKDSDTISVVPEIDGNEKTYSISVKEGSIEDKYIEPNYLANIKINSQSAELASTQATESAKNAKSYSVGGTGTREDEDIDNAKYYAEKAKEAAENASAIASVEIMTTEKAGIGKPDGKTITADEDGTMRVTSHSDVALNRQTLGYTKKNFLKLKDMTISDNEIVFNSYSSEGKVTANSAGVLTTNKFATTNDKTYLKPGTYILTGCPADGMTKGYRQTIFLLNADGSYLTEANDYGDGSIFTITQEQVDFGVYVSHTVYVFSNCTDTNITFYPMIRSSDITDDTFELYADDVDTRLNTAKSENSITKQTLGYTKKNLLKIVDGSETVTGVGFIQNSSNGTVIANGTATATAIPRTLQNANGRLYLKAGTYTLSGCPSGGAWNVYCLGITIYSSIKNHDVYEYGNSTTFTITQEEENVGAYILLAPIVFAGYTANNLTFRPMIRSADVIDDTFEPYVDDVDTRLKALTPVNNFLATVPGSPLDATMGKTLNDKVTAVETKQGGCYLKYENGKFYIGIDDTVMGV